MLGSPRTYYNENDKFAAAWLRNLIAANLIADGDVDERDIRDVYPIDLIGYTQCHFFAGIGGWSYALRLAGWPDDGPCWTGSCPCQPFSAAGQGAGFDDERHLWPAFFHLTQQCKPPVVFGEQVASKAGLAWLDLVQTDLEAAGYAAGAVDLCAAGVGAPHIRQRLFWCANTLWPGRAERRSWARNGSATGSSGAGCSSLSLHPQRRALDEYRENGCDWEDTGWTETHSELRACGEILISADTDGRARLACESQQTERPRIVGPCSEVGLSANAEHPQRGAESPEHANSHGRDGSGGGSISSGTSPLHQPAGIGCERSGSEPEHGQLGLTSAPSSSSNPSRQRLQEQLLDGRISIATMEPSEGEAFVRAGYTRGFWGGCDWWHGRDEKFRPIEPGVQPLASGVQKRVGKLRGYGNSIVPQVAAEFIAAYMDCCPS